MPENKRQNTNKPKTAAAGSPEYPRRVKFFTLGCKVNQYETQAIRENFLGAGFAESTGRAADVCVINACCVTARAASESQRLIKRLRQSHPHSRAIVTACLTE